jgi:hypothetical protein
MNLELAKADTVVAGCPLAPVPRRDLRGESPPLAGDGCIVWNDDGPRPFASQGRGRLPRRAEGLLPESTRLSGAKVR